MNRDLMQAIVKSLNTSAIDEQIVAEYYYLDGDIRVIDIEGKEFRIVNGKIMDEIGRIYHTREELIGRMHVCPMCGESYVAETVATPVISVSANNNGLIIDDGMSGYDYGIDDNTTLYCPHCNAEMLPFSEIDEKVCVQGIVYPYCLPPTKNDMFVLLSEYLYEYVQYGEEEIGIPVEDAVMQYIFSKYSGFIELYGIEEKEILQKIDEGVERWCATNAVRY